MQSIDQTAAAGQEEAGMGKAEKAAEERHETPVATLTRMFALLSVESKAETVEFVRNLVPGVGDCFSRALPSLLRDGICTSERRVLLGSIVDAGLRLSLTGINRLDDFAGDLLRGEGKAVLVDDDVPPVYVEDIDGDGKTFTGAIVQIMEGLSVDGKAHILECALAEHHGHSLPVALEDTAEYLPRSLMGIQGPARGKIVLKSLADMLLAPTEAKKATA